MLRAAEWTPPARICGPDDRLATAELDLGALLDSQSPVLLGLELDESEALAVAAVVPHKADISWVVLGEDFLDLIGDNTLRHAPHENCIALVLGAGAGWADLEGTVVDDDGLLAGKSVLAGLLRSELDEARAAGNRLATEPLGEDAHTLDGAELAETISNGLAFRTVSNVAHKHSLGFDLAHRVAGHNRYFDRIPVKK